MYRRIPILLIALVTTKLVAQDGDFLIRNVRVFDGYEIRNAVDVRIENGLIADLAPNLDSQGHAAIDGSGATLMPGLIDAHVHIYDSVLLRDALRFGVTTVIDLGSDGTALASRDEAIDRSDMADARVAGFFATAPGGAATNYVPDVPTVTDPESAIRFVESRMADGANHIKFMLGGSRDRPQGFPTLDADTVRALVATAHERGFRVIAHIESTNDARVAIAAGADILSHHWRDTGSEPELAQLIADRGVFIMPTLTVPDSATGTGQASLLADERITAFLSPQQVQIFEREPFPVPDPERNFAAFRSLLDAGAPMLAGTDGTASGPIAALEGRHGSRSSALSGKGVPKIRNLFSPPRRFA